MYILSMLYEKPSWRTHKYAGMNAFDFPTAVYFSLKAFLKGVCLIR